MCWSKITAGLRPQRSMQDLFVLQHWKHLRKFSWLRLPLSVTPPAAAAAAVAGGAERGVGGGVEAVLHWPLLIFLIKPWLELFSSSSLITFVTCSSCPQLLRGHWRGDPSEEGDKRTERRLQTGRATAIGTWVDRCPCVNIDMFAKVRAQHLLP